MSATDMNHKILEALHIDGRASWQRIADAIGENERTVARRGNQLLDSGMVRIVALSVPAHGFVVTLSCGPGQARMSATALSKHESAMWVHLVSGDSDIVSAVAVPESEEEEFLLDELPTTPGVASWRAYPVLSYLRTARSWRPGVLSESERDRLLESTPRAVELRLRTDLEPSGEDAAILHTLRDDGRRSYEEIARHIGTSVATARRRVERLRTEGLLQIRAVLAPRHLGLMTEVVMWLRVRDSEISRAAELLAADENIKYVVRVAGEWSYVLKFDVVDRHHIDEFLRDAVWIGYVAASRISLVVSTSKRNSTRQRAARR